MMQSATAHRCFFFGTVVWPCTRSSALRTYQNDKAQAAAPPHRIIYLVGQKLTEVDMSRWIEGQMFYTIILCELGNG